jgi:hypothetical protein
MAVTSGWDLGSEAERKPECDRNPCKVQRGLPHSKTRDARCSAGVGITEERLASQRLFL